MSFSKSALDDFAKKSLVTSTLPESASVALNKALVICRDALKGFDTWPERVAAIESLRQRIVTIAASGPPTAESLQSISNELLKLGLASHEDSTANLEFLNYQALQDAYLEDLDFEATKAAEIRKQRRWLLNK